MIILYYGSIFLHSIHKTRYFNDLLIIICQLIVGYYHIDVAIPISGRIQFLTGDVVIVTSCIYTALLSTDGTSCARCSYLLMPSLHAHARVHNKILDKNFRDFSRTKLLFSRTCTLHNKFKFIFVYITPLNRKNIKIEAIKIKPYFETSPTNIGRMRTSL